MRNGRRMYGKEEGCPERAKDVASEGRATRGTEAGADINGWQQPDAMEAGSKEVGDFAIWQNLRLF
ncbi:MAG: hypothetical protein PUC56_00415 [Bacteroidales bacterium]|nr:hypothetical protein [Bacteroidales bacterium]